MRAVGIVCEYNPFHLGHRFQLAESRRRAPEAAIVCVQSGDFVQRGEAAVFTKFARAEAACRSGADLVLELPLPWCLSSAEGFAFGALSLLDAVGCEMLSFGSESGELARLRSIADLLTRPDTNARIQTLLRADRNLSYAAARERLLLDALGEAGRLDAPNDILGVEYLKALGRLQSPMEPLCIRRVGAMHDRSAEGGIRSASELRQRLRAGESIAAFVPEEALAVYRREAALGRQAGGERMELILRARLCALSERDFDHLPDGGNGAGRRLYKTLQQGLPLEETVRRAATRAYPRARMRRLLLAAALGLYTDYTKRRPPYARVLACGEKGRQFLRESAQNAALPLLTKPAAARKLGGEAEAVFALGAAAHELFCLQFGLNAAGSPGADWRTGPFVV